MADTRSSDVFALCALVVSFTLSLVATGLFFHRCQQLHLRHRRLPLGWYAKLAVFIALAVAVTDTSSLVRVIQAPELGLKLWLVAAKFASLLASLALSLLVFLEYRQHGRSSDFIAFYLLGSVALLGFVPAFFKLDAVEQRNSTARVAKVCLQITLLCLGSGTTTVHRNLMERELSPEFASGVIGRVLYLWINAILAKAARRPLKVEDLPCLDEEVSTDKAEVEALRAWHSRTKPDNDWTLFFVLLRTLKKPFVKILFSRLFIIIFRFAQPALVGETIRFVSEIQSEGDKRLRGSRILATAVLVSIGLAISNNLFERQVVRLRLVIRASLISLIYNRIMDVRSGVDKGQAVTLMGTDCDALDFIGIWGYDVWGQSFEAVVALALIYREAPEIFLLTMSFIVLCLFLSFHIAKRMQVRQKKWAVATQGRLHAASSTILGIKSVKSLGLDDKACTRLRNLRQFELAEATKFRRLEIGSSAIASLILNLTPALAFIVYNVSATGSLDVDTLFKLVLLTGMLARSVNMIASWFPLILGGVASYVRIQSYLIEGTRLDQRYISVGKGLEGSEPRPAISLRGVCVKAVEDSSLVLRDVNVQIMQHNIVLCHGPMGSGKSIFAKVILAEIPLSSGNIEIISKKVGYCDQTLWLPQGTIRDIICGFDPSPNESRYLESIHACCLYDDLASFPDGGLKTVFNGGINLSGGQRQRLGLARIVYMRSETVILDDSFSALDRNTRDLIISNLLGPSGLFRRRKTTVLWISSDARFMHFADQILTVRDSRITQSQSNRKHEVNHAEDIALGAWNASAKEVDQSSLFHPESELQEQKIEETDIVALADPKEPTERDSVYRVYFQNTGLLNILAMICFTACYGFLTAFPYYWLKWWGTALTNITTLWRLSYMGIAFAAWFCYIGGSWLSTRMALKSGSQFHKSLLQTIMQAPLSFFSATHEGVILNLFSQDIQSVDKTLPPAIFLFTHQLLKIFIHTLLVYSVSKRVIFILPACIAVLYIVRKLYIHTSRRLRALDMESRSALFTSFLETVEGIATIRALQWQCMMVSRNTKSLDISQRTAYMLMSLKRWLTLILGLTEAGITIVIVATVVHLRDQFTGATVGLLFTVVLDTATALRLLVESWTTLDVALGAVERLQRAKLCTPQESSEDSIFVIPQTGWPQYGHIEICDLASSYSNENPALHNVCLDVPAGQKVFVCGRTGSGKSTLLLALQGLVNYSGVIKVDGVDISKVSPLVLRQRCFIAIPQENYHTPEESLYINIDPFGEAPRQLVFDALIKTRLWGHFINAPNNERQSPLKIDNILSTTLSCLPAMSKGQLQLLNIARALVRNGMCSYSTGATAKPVILLDEATSSMDSEMEQAMDRLIDEEFVSKGHTVIAVTHRLDATYRLDNAAKRPRLVEEAILSLQAGKVTKISQNSI